MTYCLDTNVVVYPDAIVCATAKIKSATLLTNDDRLLGVAGVTSARVVVARP